MPLSPDRPILVIGGALAYRHYYRELLMLPGTRPHIHIHRAEQMRGRRFIWDDIVWLWDAGKLRDFDDLYRYARHIASVYDSRDNDESGTVRGRGEEPPHTD
jgi:hypothetical protein